VDNGLALGDVLTSDKVSEVLQYLGVSDYLKQDSCAIGTAPFNGATAAGFINGIYTD